ncbi:MAG: NlpC/P60 family protein [Phyllobacteriaceae bacterium]|jgi:cell wall-associated NlpC family hydrolase|nr:NlpC/P60 family protein [Phyllobacteriaceae bacterium]
MTETPLDPRLHAFRRDLADARLRGLVDANHFADGEELVVRDAVVDMRTQPMPQAGLGTQLLHGDRVRMFQADEGWAWVQARRDGYVGYVAQRALAKPSDLANGTHRIAVARTFLYEEPDFKRPPADCLSMGSLISVADIVENRNIAYARLTDGRYCPAGHVRRANDHGADYVTAAETLLHTPYLWGGTSAFGIDCSGLVQLAMLMAGRAVPRDSDMQETELGDPIDPANGLRRGDLVFWAGHVGIMRDGKTLLHANAHAMAVSNEPLGEAIDRIARLYGQPTGYRRP